MKFESSRKALDWMIQHPLERVYDKYGNYSVYRSDLNIIESFYYTGDWEDENGNFEPGYWDMYNYQVDEFITVFENDMLETMI